MRDLMSGRERAAYGCIVSFESAAGAELTLHRIGPARESLRAVCADALVRDQSYRVVAYSTPQTIYGDLNGRMDYDGRNQAGDTNKRVNALRPEVIALGSVGLGWMAHPRLGYGNAGTQATTRGGTRRGS